MIAVDWGTSSLRVFRLNASGQIVDSRRSMQGVLAAGGQFEDVLIHAIEGWDDRLVVMAGMVGSRQGWQEVPYVECPAGIESIAQGMMPLASSALPARDIWIAPGLSIGSDAGHDVMRGEETQLCGMLGEMAQGTHLACLAGTHSKLATIEYGFIVHFHTAMTGELFALLCEHSILGRLMQRQEHHLDAFLRGVDDSRKRGSLLRQLFAVRTHGLFGTMQPEDLRSYLSGLLIGHELNDLPARDGTIHLVAAPSLMAPYDAALTRRGYHVRPQSDGITAKGIHALARMRGLPGC